ncbi:MIND complex subunit NSL1 [Cyberlindnera jadinii NRRL Y-1542]|uniref:Mis14-domain-containing protein n=1 Tax=Cyberlindnera jadinii (strain ATCC 18201 / CBS 1600 / BCRC 20928 / JCM 3617 / NBRC 0987 / NRRL Y-1542) TaxID=983966 RepID=A0A1E4S7U8_CYBJN|nr:Mis14-domain-containing protein [Cyberlindnera jadinii NRRL Y-1542]ODV75560.1 Mis14-domain-containing protein [Cyberlindnera jadinii NRRL Y-1542]
MEQQKVALALADVKHLQAALSKEAKNKLDLYLPNADDKDALKSKVFSLVDDFIYEIFERSKDGMEIDGMDRSVSLRSMLENPTNEVEPFDFALQEEVRKLYQEVEDETMRLTKLRREKPQSLKRSYEESFNSSMEKLHSLEREIEALEEEEDSRDTELDAHMDKVQSLRPKLDEMTREYADSLHSLKEIRDEIPKQRDELSKLNQITKFILEKK